MNKAIDSLLLSVEQFNRPWDRGRVESVVIFLDHGFELLLKSHIVEKNEKIREPNKNETIGFKACLNKCFSDDQCKCITEEQLITLKMINGLRDAAYHYVLDISEQFLYMHIQAGITLFSAILLNSFGIRLAEYFPNHVLPVTVQPPLGLPVVMSKDYKQILELLSVNKRKKIESKAKLRSLAIIENAILGGEGQPSEKQINKLIKNIKNGYDWTSVFPGISTLTLQNQENGIGFYFKIVKHDGIPIRVVQEEQETGVPVIIKRVDDLGYYNMSITQLAQHIGTSVPKTTALARSVKLQENPEYFKEIRIGKVCYKRYSQKTIELLQKLIREVNINEVWEIYRPRQTPRVSAG